MYCAAHWQPVDWWYCFLNANGVSLFPLPLPPFPFLSFPVFFFAIFCLCPSLIPLARLPSFSYSTSALPEPLADTRFKIISLGMCWSLYYPPLSRYCTWGEGNFLKLTPPFTLCRLPPQTLLFIMPMTAYIILKVKEVGDLIYNLYSSGNILCKPSLNCFKLKLNFCQASPVMFSLTSKSSSLNKYQLQKHILKENEEEDFIS